MLRRRQEAGLRIKILINDEDFAVEVRPGEALLEVLRRLGFKGAKRACDTASCGACTVLLDGRAVASCIVLAVQAEGRSITTIEGLTGDDGGLHPVQEAFLRAGAPQCGYCTPGMVMAVVGLLSENPGPTRDQVREAISGNICRCSGYVKIVDAVIDAAEKLRAIDAKKGSQHEPKR
jgi:carbon-monoxide dehydrogenase small subunit